MEPSLVDNLIAESKTLNTLFSQEEAVKGLNLADKYLIQKKLDHHFSPPPASLYKLYCNVSYFSIVERLESLIKTLGYIKDSSIKNYPSFYYNYYEIVIYFIAIFPQYNMDLINIARMEGVSNWSLKKTTLIT